jgi:hypothetical protein
MKRDMDLIRNMLLLIEADSDVPPKTVKADTFLDLCDNPSMIALHLELLADSGLVDLRKMPNGSYEVKRITGAGYDYLDSVRSAKVWRNVKDRLSVVGGASFEIIKAVAIEEVKKALLG